LPGAKSTLAENVDQQYLLGSHTLDNSGVLTTDIMKAAQTGVNGLPSRPAELLLQVNAGTDATVVRAGSSLLDPATLTTKISNAESIIRASHALTDSSKDHIIHQINTTLSAPANAQSGILLKMRNIDGILQTIKGLESTNASWASEWATNEASRLDLKVDILGGVAGSNPHKAAERFATATLKAVAPGRSI